MTADSTDLLARLPHRPPFRFLDEVRDVECDAEAARGVGRWTIRGDEAFLAGHFPGRPLVPGVLITESAAQLAGVVASRWTEHMGDASTGGGMLVLSEARFKRAVAPPADLDLEVVLDRVMGSIHRYEFTARLEATVVAFGVVAVSLGPAGEGP